MSTGNIYIEIGHVSIISMLVVYGSVFFPVSSYNEHIQEKQQLHY